MANVRIRRPHCQIVRPNAVAEYLGVSVPTAIKIAREDPTFPAEIQITDHIRGYLKAEVNAWLRSKRKPKSPLFPSEDLWRS